MSDSFLDAHRIRLLEFNISSPYTPISIKDQMIRAKMLVDRLIEQGFLSVDRPLFIVGAGAAGASAALEAASFDIPVVMIDWAPGPFGLQRQCLSRWIDPVQYDWPADHWDKAVFPWREPSMPLPWSANRANYLAGAWIAELAKAQRKWPHLRIFYSAEITAANPDDSGTSLNVRYRLGDGTVHTESFGASVYAVGYGQEQCGVGRFTGFDFWQTDPLEFPLLGCDAPEGGRRLFVKIWGGGDGALQDFLRICTGLRSVREIMRRIAPEFPNELRLRLFSEEDQARRASVWNNKDQDHAVLSRLQRVHRRVAEMALEIPELRARLSDLLMPRLVLLDVELLHHCDHFARAYCLNRFLATLILTLAHQYGLTAVSRPHSALMSVDGIAHECSGDAAACFGLEHHMTARSGAECGRPADGDLFHMAADAVIVRLGVAPPDMIVKLQEKKGPFNSRHLLPYTAAQ